MSIQNSVTKRAAMRLTLLLLFGFVCEISHAIHIKRKNTKYVDYLTRYGYLEASSVRCDHKYCKVNSKTFKNAVISLQHFAHLDATGKLDRKTRHWMSLIRCGIRDVYRSRSKRNSLVLGKWPKRYLTYMITNYPSTKGHHDIDIDSMVSLAFMIWTSPTGIVFAQKEEGPVNIIIKFGSLEQEMGKIRYANTKTDRTSTITINDDIPWETEAPNVPSLFQTLIHEIGHVIGLGHTDVVDAMMYPVYKFGNMIYSLHEDDIRTAQEIYKDKVVSYPNRYQYLKFKRDFEKAFTDFNKDMKDAFGIDIPIPEMPNEFFPEGY
ncbi:matrix metalloproteinase-9-like [Zerene cesonia]|uniref:matrix metalloproteinase-9-like n=1 Tax=Zerene cesonia TaxID=33412 RepID=UPI0018E50174|nr:matrix metalloproteinase-9-like [Zerene cesonia]